MINFTENIISVHASAVDCLEPAPEYYENLMHYLHFITLPNYIISLYVLICNAPPALRQYRNYLLWHTFGNIIFEIYISVFFLPVTYLPLVVFRGAGILKYNNTQGLLQFYLMIFCVVHTGTSILELFRYRFDAAIGEETLSKKILHKIVIFFWIFALGIPIFCIITMPTCVPKQDHFKQNLIREYPNSPIQILCDTTVVAPPLLDPIFTPILSLIVFAIITAAIIIPHITVTIWMRLDYLSMHLSAKTVQLQKMLLMSLFIQAAIHGTLLGIPIFGFLYAILFSLEHDWIAYILLLLVSFHGSVSTVAMVYFTKPIRLAYVGVIFRIFRIEPKKVDDIGLGQREIFSTTVASKKSSVFSVTAVQLF
ncbi:unnamed protein product [Caenorhabditis angaria]|uniref:Serpentine Receptor, class H n=1 Tax=Caenorhabditis angaria TaxID=860376 RepID=A0A9P1ITK9_9PELO|nr:unnamed protein product [Caenorhabditis angaria]